MTWNNKVGKATNNCLRRRQGCLFASCRALIFTYDNYQRGLLIKHQRGSHSSAFFKGTHQVTHKAFPFEDCTFDKMHVIFTQHQQAIPSPWGMPGFELVNILHPAEIFINYDNFETITTPDFTDERVDSYILHWIG